MKKQHLLVGGLMAVLMAHTSVRAFDDAAKLGDATAKALAIVTKARDAAGGAQNLTSVCRLSAKGSATHTSPNGDVVRPFDLTIAIGGEAGEDVAFVGPADELSGTKKRIVIRKIETGTAAGAGDEEGMQKRTVVIADESGESKDGNVLFVRPAPAPDGEMSQERRVMIFKKGPGDAEQVNVIGHGALSPMFEGRAVGSFVELLLGRDGGAVTYNYVGLLDTPDGRFEAVDVTNPIGMTSRFFFDPTSGQAVMLTFTDAPLALEWKEAESAPNSKRRIAATISPSTVDTKAEVTVRFSDYRADGALVLPHRFTVSTNGQPAHDIAIESFTTGGCGSN